MDELKIIKRELEKHRGKGNEISAGVIGKKLGYSADDTHVRARKRIKECAEKYDIPLAGNNKGYFIITTEDELNAYKNNLDSRIKEIRERKAIMEKNYREWNK